MPPDLAKTYKLGSLCGRQHDWNNTGQSLRKRSNGGCKQCQDAQVKRSLPVARRPSHPAPTSPERPALPAHLWDRCFLSPITCQDPMHRYRDTAYTLRFLDSEGCVKCLMPSLTLAGD